MSRLMGHNSEFKPGRKRRRQRTKSVIIKITKEQAVRCTTLVEDGKDVADILTPISTLRSGDGRFREPNADTRAEVTVETK